MMGGDGLDWQMRADACGSVKQRDIYSHAYVCLIMVAPCTHLFGSYNTLWMLLSDVLALVLPDVLFLGLESSVFFSSVVPTVLVSGPSFWTKRGKGDKCSVFCLCCFVLLTLGKSLSRCHSLNQGTWDVLILTDEFCISHM